MTQHMQSLLRSADPIRIDVDNELGEIVRRMSADAREESLTEPSPRTPWWKRRGTAVPFSVAGLVALTGAAVAIPLSLAINGALVGLDAEIPITYTTDNGIEINCRYGIYFGDPAGRTAADERLAQYVENHDWTGIGQRIYDEAIANPFVPGPNDDWEVDTQELRDNFSFSNALSHIVWNEIPADLQQDARSAGATTDCTGKLR